MTIAVHYLRDSLGRSYAFSRRLLPFEPAMTDTASAAVIPCRAYARQLLQSIAEATGDPFHYALMNLWLDLFQQPWARPRTQAQLLDGLAAKIADRNVAVSLVDSPLWHVASAVQPGAQE